MDKSNNMLQNTVVTMGKMLQGSGGISHMVLLILFAFVVVLLLWWTVRG